MSAAGERTDAAWRADAARVLARLARAHGLDGLRRVPVYKALLAVIGAPAVENALASTAEPPGEPELAALAKQAKDLLAERRLVRLAAAAEPRPQPPSAPPDTPAPPPAPPDSPPPVVLFHPDPAAAPGAPGLETPPADFPEGAFRTHLPLYSLQVLAASLPAGQWGRSAHAQVPERLVWMPVDLPGRRLNDHMFVARIEGHSMDDGRTGLRDGALAVFEMGAGDFDREPVVLVRGAFDDPETGAYAVKRIRLERAPDGSSERFRLLSAHPDRAVYPDIVVDERDAPSVTVLARFLAALSPEAGDRASVPAPRPRRRDLTSPEGREKHRARLAKALSAFFGPPRPAPGAAAPEEPPALPWAARLELGACDPGALTVTCGPLAGLFPRVRTVTVRTGARAAVILASNVRTKRWREPVPPSLDPYLWTAEGFEEELAEEMASLTLPGLSAEAATVFRLDAGGVGQRLAAPAVSPGSAYRLLVPPALAAVDLPGAVERGGFRALDVEVPSPVPSALVDQLRSIGVSIGADAYSMAWAVTCPRDHRPGRDGELYPCFAPGDVPCAAIAGPASLLDGDVRLVVQGEHGAEVLPLPAGDRWLVELSDLPEGNHVVEVAPLSTSIETTRLFFRIDSASRPPPRADVVVQLGDAPPLTPGHVQPAPAAAAPEPEERDLTLLGTERSPLAITAPPLWPVAAHWHGSNRVRGPLVAAGEDGRVDVEALLGRTAAPRRSDPVGDLVLDFGELGSLVLRHQRPLADVARAELPALIRERAGVLDALAGQLDVLLPQWIEPVCALLGYRVEPLPLLATLDLPAGFAASQLTTLRRKGASFERAPAAVLVIPPARLRLSDAASLDESRAEGMRMGKKLGLRTAIVTDGRVWARVQVKSGLRPSPIDIEDALRRAALGGLDDFLDRFLAESAS